MLSSESRPSLFLLGPWSFVLAEDLGLEGSSISSFWTLFGSVEAESLVVRLAIPAVAPPRVSSVDDPLLPRPNVVNISYLLEWGPIFRYLDRLT